MSSIAGAGTGSSATSPSDVAPASPVRRTKLPLVARRLEVLRVEDLSASMRRVALGGPELAGFRSDGPTDHAKVWFPPDGRPDDAPLLPSEVDGAWVAPDGATCRDYSIRTFDPGAGEVVLDMAVHAHGPAGRWAAQARPGQQLGLLGPKTTKTPPMDRDRYVFAVDETGLPGLQSWLEQLPAGPRVRVLAEVGGTADEVPVPEHPGVEVTWLHRGTAEPGTTTLLPDAVRDALTELPDDATVWLWAAAEATVVRAIRGHVTRSGLDKRSCSMTGYWRLGVANFDHKSEDGQA
ncbi:siderophore-interacting protein [Actinotalea sp. Marseille-Q4924]|uniref:siderophore-interacting protein n=1 Tax=Actinotalea sp. Marseille-Q4924 TaxID=2866571 RepID=UPI001CE463C6|nr:siderophore-interacting protein [Actinotalea sp. Marseille-Q4924]